MLEQMKQYEQIKEKLLIRPMYFNSCRQELRQYVYKRYGDIALVLHVTVYDNEKGLGSVRVPRPTADAWKLSRKQVWEDAMQNTCVMDPPRLCREPELVLTTTRKRNGAIAMFYPGVKEQLARLSGGSYYVAFTSVHEAHIYPAGSVSLLRILRSLKHRNSTCGEKERLSRKVFLYNAEDGSFKPVDSSTIPPIYPDTPAPAPAKGCGGA